MEGITAQSIREKLTKLHSEIDTLAKDTAKLESTIIISRRKNNMLAKDVQELKRRREEQTAVLAKEENKVYVLARELSEHEDKISEIEAELQEVQSINRRIEEEIQTRRETVKEYELVLGLHEGYSLLH